FQAEDGIRDRTVTGVQTCALPIFDYKKVLERETAGRGESARRDDIWESIVNQIVIGDRAMFDERAQQRLLAIAGSPIDIGDLARSKERRVGKECGCRGGQERGGDR